MISLVREPPALSTVPTGTFLSSPVPHQSQPTHLDTELPVPSVSSEVQTGNGTPHLTACADLEEWGSELVCDRPCFEDHHFSEQPSRDKDV